MIRKLLIILCLLLIALPFVLVLAYRVVPVPATPLMVLRLFEGEGWTRDWTPLSRISVYVPEAVIAAEDNKFCRHDGFDWEALGEQVDAALSGDRPRGASTVSMQVAKNLFLWPGRDYLRKGLEAYMTVFVEGLLPKRRIMEIYLNIVEWGPGIYGIEAAARHYFHTEAANLSRSQAALLAAVLPNPREWSAQPADSYVAERAAQLRRRMNQLGPLLDCVRT